MSFIDDQAKAWAEIPELTKLSDPIPETVNGPGATLAITERLRTALPELLAKYDVHSVLDIGCGDWNWMSHVDLGDVAYLGWDVDYTTIERNKATYGERANVAFDCVNLLTVEAVPKVDLILARHVLIHFPNDYTVALLGKLFASGSRYLLTSTWPGTENVEYEPEGFAYRGYVERTVNLEAAPFGLRPPIDSLYELPAEQGVISQAHELALYELIPVITAGGTEAEPGLTTAIITEPTKPCECEGGHGAPYKVHRSDGVVQTRCTVCHGLIDEAAEPDEDFSLMGTVSKWAQRVTGEGAEGLTRAFETAGVRSGEMFSSGFVDRPKPPDASVTLTDVDTGVTRIVPAQRGETKRTKLALVDKQKLRAIRDNHQQAIEMARQDVSLEAAWLTIGVQAAAIDAILTELTRDE